MNGQPSALRRSPGDAAGQSEAGPRPPEGPQPQSGGDAATAPIVEFRNISKTYDGLANAVENLNLDIGRGEFLTLLGPSADKFIKPERIALLPAGDNLKTGPHIGSEEARAFWLDHLEELTEPFNTWSGSSK